MDSVGGEDDVAFACDKLSFHLYIGPNEEQQVGVCGTIIGTWSQLLQRYVIRETSLAADMSSCRVFENHLFILRHFLMLTGDGSCRILVNSFAMHVVCAGGSATLLAFDIYTSLAIILLVPW